RPHDRIAEAVPSFEHGEDLLVAIFDFDLRDQCGVRLTLEERLHAIRLAPNAIDGDDLRPIGQLVDVVADVGICGGEDDASIALARQQLLLEVERDRSLQIVRPSVDLITVDFQRLVHRYPSNSAKVTTLFFPDRSSSNRKRFNGTTPSLPQSAAR